MLRTPAEKFGYLKPFSVHRPNLKCGFATSWEGGRAWARPPEGRLTRKIHLALANRELTMYFPFHEDEIHGGNQTNECGIVIPGEMLLEGHH